MPDDDSVFSTEEHTSEVEASEEYTSEDFSYESADLSAPSIPSTAAAAREVDEHELERALNSVVRDSLSPLLVGLSVLYLVQMVTHTVLLGQPNAAYNSLMAAGSSVVLLLLRMALTGVDAESHQVYVIGTVAVAIALGNTLWAQALTEGVQVVAMGLLLVGTGFVFLSTAWFVGILAVSMVAWLLVTAALHPPAELFFPTINLSGTAALATMMHVVRRRTNRRAERLRRATEQQQEALAQALIVEEHHRRSLAESEASLEEALNDLQRAKNALEDREQRLSRTVDELTAAKEKAEEASQLKSAMLANMSHEVRTPLTSITGFAELMAEEASGQAQRFATLIYDNSQRLLETLGSVLRLSKLEAGNQTLRFEEMDLVEEAESLAAEQSERAHEAGVNLELDLDSETCRCLLDRGAVQRILRNLVGNAIKFTDEGGTVTIRLEQIREACRPDAGEMAFTHARLEVEDTGEGMSESFQSDMFKAFRQEEQTARRDHEGSGLGLSITKQLVDLLRGEITVASEKGEGTCFTICLSRVPEGADPSALEVETSEEDDVENNGRPAAVEKKARDVSDASSAETSPDAAEAIEDSPEQTENVSERVEGAA
jgi:signal transduction histidine kinase